MIKVMFRLLILSFVCFLAFAKAVVGQDQTTPKQKFQAPDYKAIGAVVSQESSDLYLLKLLERYEAADSTMTLKERRHLYYGYRYHENYSPYNISIFKDSLRALYQKPDLKAEDYKKMVNYADLVLQERPFDLSIIYEKMMIHKGMENEEAYQKERTKSRILIDAILSSGDGMTKSTAYYVIDPSHEYMIINVLGLEYGGKQMLEETFDFLTVNENLYGIRGLFFDVSPSLEAMTDMFKN